MNKNQMKQTSNVVVDCHFNNYNAALKMTEITPVVLESMFAIEMNFFNKHIIKVKPSKRAEELIRELLSEDTIVMEVREI